MENNPKITAITLLVVTILGLGGFYILKQHKNPFEPQRPPVELPISPDLPQRFEDLLNTFLQNVDKEMTDYRNERRILVETFNPANLRDPLYIEENQKIVQELVPALRGRIDGVVRLFEKAELDIDQLLSNQPEAARQNILRQWHLLKNTQGETYMQFFSYENELLATYSALMNLYYTHRNDLEADIDTHDIIFKHPADKIEEERLRQRIKDLSSAQNEALKKSLPKESQKSAHP
jgi:hypothetical protein